jgi:hypothetical protein
MAHTTSDAHLFTSERSLRDAVSVASDALLIALQREHPQIVRHLQEQAAANRAPDGAV